MMRSSLWCIEAMLRACAVQLAHRAGGPVIATCRAESDKGIASRAGADEVLLVCEELVERIWALAVDGVRHVVEVAFAEGDAKLPIDFGVKRHLSLFANEEEQC